MPPEALAFYRAQAPRDCYVWAENWPALEAFAACSTQWRILPMGGNQGIDYPSLQAVLWARDIPRRDRSRIFDDVRLIERGALAAMSGKSLEDLING